ncbi:MAG TPA: metalloregulator ArsR/SmtB family transcription factor [Phototrophicaceae bacterium]|nr:metalloregulator ArsR/SmtB family transcription factor [Phototrophicaceae bacterium]
MKPVYESMAVVFHALSHPVRLQILDLLRGGEICVCQIEAALDKRQAYISQQLMVLRETGLVETRKEGLQVFYRLANPLVEDLLHLAFGPDIADVPAICPPEILITSVQIES